MGSKKAVNESRPWTKLGPLEWLLRLVRVAGPQSDPVRDETSHVRVDVERHPDHTDTEEHAALGKRAQASLARKLQDEVVMLHVEPRGSAGGLLGVAELEEEVLRHASLGPIRVGPPLPVVSIDLATISREDVEQGSAIRLREFGHAGLEDEHDLLRRTHPVVLLAMGSVQDQAAVGEERLEIDEVDYVVELEQLSEKWRR